MTRKTRYLALAGLWLVAGSCALNFDAETLGIRATVAEPAAVQTVGDDFEISHKAVFGLWGILPIAKPSLERALAGQLIDGTEVANLDIKVRSRLGDVIVTVLTGGLIVPRSVTFTGTVINRGQ